MHLPRTAALVLAAALALFPVLGTLAQDDQTPRADPNAPLGQKKSTTARIDLAAIALDDADVGASYGLSFETYIPADQLSALLFNGAISASQVKSTGIRWYYESQYVTADGVTTLTCYVEEYPNVAGVTKGFNIFENEDLKSPPTATSTDAKGLPGVGSTPSEVTTTKVKASGSTPAGTTLDATFRVDRLLMGVSIATTATTPPKEQDLTDLAKRLQERAQAVLDGKELPEIDSALPARLLDFAESFDVDEGYTTFAATFGPSAPTGIDATFQSGYTRTVALGQDPNAKVPLPLVTVGVSEFNTESSGLAILSNSISTSPPYKGMARVETDPIPGTSASVGLSFADPFNNGDANSFRLFVLIDTNLINIDVIGADTLDHAQAAALSLAKQEAGCFGDNAKCGTAALPPNFAGAKG
jgi:hypothetical protein